MASVKKMQEEAMASIDTAKALVDKVLTIMEIIIVDPSLALSFSTNPIGYLIQLLKHLGVTREELELWLTNFLVYVVPVLEISVKAILLTNLKNMISCSVDPRIPEKYRKQHKGATNYNTSQEYGIDINIESIDFMDKLSINPLGEFGTNWYFGLEGVEDSYKFARADDMDAFLWFVIHKGKFPNSSRIEHIGDIGGNDTTVTVLPSSGSLLSTVDVLYEKDKSSSILLGNTFAYSGMSHIISMCIDKKTGDAENIVHNTLVPISDDWSSVNWYARRADQLGKNLGFGWGVNQKNGTTKYKGKGRDFSKERGLCNIQYIDQASNDAPLTGLVNNKFRFTILPKPYVHIPILSQGEPPWRFKKMLFNDKGEYDPNGKYTFLEGAVTESATTNNVIFYISSVTVATMDIRSGNVSASTEHREILIRNLVECYPGLTVFEFNYDYVTSIKLFDAKVLAHSLMESVLNTNLGIGVNMGIKHQEGTETIKEIIKNILERDDSEINDCYYTFDNAKYDSLLRKAEEKRARQQRFGNVTHEIGMFNSVNDILNEYDANAELHQQIDVLHRAITQAAVTVSEGVPDSNKFDVEFNFIFDLIEALTTAIVNGILSPKVLMLLEVNQKIMGGTWEKFTMKDLLEALRSIIVAIIKEIRDLVIQELLKLVLKVLEPIIQTIAAILLREQLESYADAILEIVRNCPFIWFRFGNQDQDTKLDTVDYADIDVSHTKEGEQPSTNNC
jgi:hypothetical protein